MMRLDRWKALWSLAMLCFFGGVVVSVLAGDESGSAAAATAAETQPAHGEPQGHGDQAQAHEDASARSVPSRQAAPDDDDEGEDGSCLADQAAIEDLRRQRQELEARERAMAAREAELKAREQALSDEIKKIAEARDEVIKLDLAARREGEAKVAKLVETIESMNPKAAANLVASIDEGLAVQAMSRLSTLKLAKMMNVMDPQRSTKLSELLAGVTRAKRMKPAQDDAAAVTSERARTQQSTQQSMQQSMQQPGRELSPAKGGEKDDGKSHEQTVSHRSADGVAEDGAARRQPAAAGGKGEVARK